MLRRAAAVRGGGWVAAAGHRGLFHLSKNNIGVSIFSIGRLQSTPFARNHLATYTFQPPHSGATAEPRLVRSMHAVPPTHQWGEMRPHLLQFLWHGLNCVLSGAP